MNRRDILKSSLVTSAGIANLAGCSSFTKQLVPWKQMRKSRLNTVGDLPKGLTRRWIGSSYWANRLQDWRLSDGRIECMRGSQHYELRTVNILTRELISGKFPGHIQVTTGIVGSGTRGGFCGFLIGIGNGKLDYRAAALAQRGSGTGGGFLCTLNQAGQLAFREHTDEFHPLKFSELPSEKEYSEITSGPFTAGDEVKLNLDILTDNNGSFTVQVTAHDALTEKFLGKATRYQVPSRELLGGISLVSSPPPGKRGTRWWFKNVQTGGEKVARYSDRTFGPIAGTQYSVDSDSDTLRLSVQLMPIQKGQDYGLFLEYRPKDSSQMWTRGPSTKVESGYTALFRVEGWDSTQSWEYRVVYRPKNRPSTTFTGEIQSDLGSNAENFKIGLFSCAAPTARGLEAGSVTKNSTPAERLGRYTNENIYFPYQTLIHNAQLQNFDFLVFTGDQIYQKNPTRVTDREDAALDYLYKWYLWVWAYRNLIRNIPSVVLIDDHDVYQQNLWGEKGKQAPHNNARKGGYLGDSKFINLIQRTQCNHNPDPFDPRPVKRRISVYYTSFRYGGVDFALLEDRKFKTSPPKGDLFEKVGLDRALLGTRQKRFLNEWSESLDEESLPICLSQSLYACVETTPNGLPAMDLDSNGYPPSQRDEAVNLLRKAGAMVLSGDRHLATLVRHGVTTHTDGVLEFSGPASAAIYQRWFNPQWSLANGSSNPNTGDFTDIFGNKVRVLAVANPKVKFEKYRNQEHERGHAIGDQELKSEGYGVVRVNHKRKQCAIECWPWNEDPIDTSSVQFPGWPIILSFDEMKNQN